MKSISGLGKEARKLLTKVLRGTKGTISTPQVAAILEVPPDRAARLLSRWREQGWVSRIKRGMYIPVPLDAASPDTAVEDPWVIAERLYSPCYIGGWSAAEHWGLTEQIFRTLLVMTTKKPRDRRPKINGVDFLLRTVPSKAFFGLKAVWKGQTKVNVSDQARTIIDMLDNPALGGGLRPTIDMLQDYLKSEAGSTDNLVQYANQLGNGAVFKRLGFLLELYAPNETAAIRACREGMKKGNVKLDPALEGGRLVTRWKLWVPRNWVPTRADKSRGLL